MTLETNENQFREVLFEDIIIERGSKVLVTSVGLGNDLIWLKKKFGYLGIDLYCQDLSLSMLQGAIKNLIKRDVDVSELNLSSISALPYKSNFFDCSFHFGSINQLSNKKIAIDEIFRVTRIGGQILIGDEGVAPNLKKTQIGKALIRNNNFWDATPPIEFLPENVDEVKLRYIFKGTFYMLNFIKVSENFRINLDIEHKGIRGGTIRKRFFGDLGGVDPELKNKIFIEAERKQISVTNLLESIIGNYLENSH